MKKLLIANRGEIAVRVARAARDYGAASVAVYAEDDAEALHVTLADEAYGLGPGRPSETYLDGAKLLAVAARAGADAVHPGYGFLSERADFAEAVTAAGLTWVGPRPETIRALGDKLEARRIAASVGAPLVRGSDGPLASAAEAVAFARAVGLPIAIKAAHGGGGRGMKVAYTLGEVGELFDSAVREAEAAFGRGECYAEQFMSRPRHVEAQVLADSHGTVMVLGTRDCTLQRRNQKLVEEAPAPFLTDEQRTRIHEAATAICAAAGYISAGTVEFLLSDTGALSFLEVNTRLQVEHPVTEDTTGIDIVVEQLRIADGLALSVTAVPEPRGHAIEFRINAEDPGRGFLPTPGRITRFRPPTGPGVRLDTGVETGSAVPGLYDSLMAKLIVTGPTRDVALRRARRALAEFTIEGVASVLPFHIAAVNHPDFIGEDGFRVHTTWIESDFGALPPALRVDPAEADMIRGFVEIDGRRHALGVPSRFFSTLVPVAAPPRAQPEPPSDSGITAPISGRLQRWLVSDGVDVAEGDPVALVEAMKMETRVAAPRSGRIGIKLPAGSAVEAGTVLATLE